MRIIYTNHIQISIVALSQNIPLWNWSDFRESNCSSNGRILPPMATASPGNLLESSVGMGSGIRIREYRLEPLFDLKKVWKNRPKSLYDFCCQSICCCNHFKCPDQLPFNERMHCVSNIRVGLLEGCDWQIPFPISSTKISNFLRINDRCFELIINFECNAPEIAILENIWTSFTSWFYWIYLSYKQNCYLKKSYTSLSVQRKWIPKFSSYLVSIFWDLDKIWNMP